MSVRQHQFEENVGHLAHLTLCRIMRSVPSGRDLLERAEMCGVPTDMNPSHSFPRSRGRSDYGIACEVARVVHLDHMRREWALDRSAQHPTDLDGRSTRMAQLTAQQILTELRQQQGLELSGCEGGLYHTAAKPAAQVRHHRAPAANAPSFVPSFLKIPGSAKRSN